MKIAFYYHKEFEIIKNNIYCPGYLGVFLDSLAAEVEKVTVLIHESSSSNNLDYKLTAKNIDFISLGKKTPAWHRMIFHKKILKHKIKLIDHYDVLLVRSPSPLSPYFSRYLKNTKLVFLIVGDYLSALESLKIRSFKSLFIVAYIYYFDYIFNKELAGKKLIVNSKVLFDKYKSLSKDINYINTTTLKSKDFFLRKDTCTEKKINLLFTGRIDLQKGLVELVKAYKIANDKFKNLQLNLVGWEEDEDRPVEKYLKKIITKLGIQNHVIFHGYKSIGYDLNKMYQMSDIYVYPSYHEGFPRAIWEAMANSLPIIATSVGSIPKILTHKTNVFLIDPKNVNNLYEAIIEIINNSSLRKKLIKNSNKLVQEMTLEKQSKKLAGYLKS